MSLYDDMLLPDGWKFIEVGKLKDSVLGGASPKGGIGAYPDGDIPCFAGGDIQGDKLLKSAEKKISKEAFEKARQFKPQTLFITRVGENSVHVGVIQQYSSANDQIIGVHFRRCVYVDYVYWWFKTYTVQKLLGTEKHGALQQSLNQKDVLSIKIPLPYPDPDDIDRSLEVQHRVLRRIEALMEEMKEARELIESMGEDTRRVMDLALAEEFSDASMESWSNEKELKDLIRNASKSINAKDLEMYRQLPHIGGADIEKGICLLIRENTLEQIKARSPRRLFEPNTILYQTLRPELRKALLVDYQGLCSREIATLTVLQEREILPRFLMWTLISPHFTRHAQRVTKFHGSQQEFSDPSNGRPRININGLLSYRLRFPDREDQKLIVDRLDYVQNEVIAMREIQKEQKVTLEELEQSILDRVFCGML